MTDAPTAAMTNEKKTTAPENYINRVTFGARLKQYVRSPLSLILMILVCWRHYSRSECSSSLSRIFL